MKNTELNQVALSATLHCLTGCAIGEVIGLIIGSIFGLHGVVTIILAIGLAFIFGYSLSLIPLLKSGMALKTALGLVLAVDTLSIATMELADNLVMVVIPGALNATLVSPLFWLSMSLALMAAFIAAYPVNKYLITKNKGHALVMEHHNHSGHQH